jgi:hypothetical protein
MKELPSSFDTERQVSISSSTNRSFNRVFPDLAVRQLTCNMNDARHAFAQNLPDRINVREHYFQFRSHYALIVYITGPLWALPKCNIGAPNIADCLC